MRQSSTTDLSSIGLWNLTIPTYSFPALCCALTNLVALFKQTIKHPVTFGSKVPLCPVFSTSKIFFIQATISWEEGFAGLSKFITPYLRCSSKGRWVGELPAFIGVYL